MIGYVLYTAVVAKFLLSVSGAVRSRNYSVTVSGGPSGGSGRYSSRVQCTRLRVFFPLFSGPHRSSPELALLR